MVKTEAAEQALPNSCGLSWDSLYMWGDFRYLRQIVYLWELNRAVLYSFVRFFYRSLNGSSSESLKTENQFQAPITCLIVDSVTLFWIDEGVFAFIKINTLNMFWNSTGGHNMCTCNTDQSAAVWWRASCQAAVLFGTEPWLTFTRTKLFAMETVTLFMPLVELIWPTSFVLTVEL